MAIWGKGLQWPGTQLERGRGQTPVFPPPLRGTIAQNPASQGRDLGAQACDDVAVMSNNPHFLFRSQGQSARRPGQCVRAVSLSLLMGALSLAGCSSSRTHVGGETDMPLANPAAASGPEDGGLSRCSKRLGSVAIAEAEGNAQALMSAGLPRSMAPLVRYMLSTTQCFKVVDRGAAFALLEQERKVRNDRGLAPPTNRRPLQTVDYILRAEIVFAEQTGGSKGILGAVFGNTVGAVGGQYGKKEAIVLLSVVDAETSEIVSSTFGRGTSDSSGLGSLVLASGAVLIDGIWADTPQAKTVAAALVDSWNRSLPKLTAFVSQQEALGVQTAKALIPEKAAAASAPSDHAGKSEGKTPTEGKAEGKDDVKGAEPASSPVLPVAVPVAPPPAPASAP